jgi:hypothetical protein
MYCKSLLGEVENKSKKLKIKIKSKCHPDARRELMKEKGKRLRIYKLLKIPIPFLRGLVPKQLEG